MPMSKFACPNFGKTRIGRRSGASWHQLASSAQVEMQERSIKHGGTADR
jgi:hypothetical protein